MPKNNVNPWGYYAEVTETPNEEKNKNEKISTELWDRYSFSPDGGAWENFIKVAQTFGKMTFDGIRGTNDEETDPNRVNNFKMEDYNSQWIHFGNAWSNRINDYWSNAFSWNFNDLSQATTFTEFITGLGHNITEGVMQTVGNGEFWGRIGDSLTLIGNGALNAVVLSAAQGINVVTSSKVISNTVKQIEQWLAGQDGNGGLFGSSTKYTSNISETVSDIAGALENTGSTFLNIIGKGLDIWSSGALRPYKNGIDETSFGRLMESSWNKNSNSFTSLLNGGASHKIIFSKTTPFDSGKNMNNLYGHMMLGAPPLFNNIADPKNRSIANTFLRDAKFITLTPGMPKYNGSNYLLGNDDAYHQTKDPESMLLYLLKNGLDSEFADRDRRYYTFKADYSEYYSYLETMLNTVWLKMGLGQETPNTYNLFSFFDVSPGKESTLKPQYNTSLGFFVNPTGALTENITNSPTTMNLAGNINNTSEDYQTINFITGMGTGGAIRQAGAISIKAQQLTRQMLEFAKTAASRTISNWQKGGSFIRKGLMSIPAAIGDVRDFVTTRDNGAVLQEFATTNGMKVVYPELWSDSTYTKSININFEFTSPYGDPLSVFNYVIAPFLALLCFAMPRQAADNGYVSPFFVRADIPGLFTSDLAMIQDFSWTKGGDSNLWTKDGLPRSISGSFLLMDLYPYLAMTKRISFLSANPNYTVFLDNLASLHAVDMGNTDDALNEYYKTLLNRVSGETAMSSLWNNYSETDRRHHATYANQVTTNRLGGNTKKYTSSSWLRGIK